MSDEKSSKVISAIDNNLIEVQRVVNEARWALSGLESQHAGATSSPAAPASPGAITSEVTAVPDPVATTQTDFQAAWDVWSNKAGVWPDLPAHIKGAFKAGWESREPTPAVTRDVDGGDYPEGECYANAYFEGADELKGKIREAETLLKKAHAELKLEQNPGHPGAVFRELEAYLTPNAKPHRRGCTGPPKCDGECLSTTRPGDSKDG